MNWRMLCKDVPVVDAVSMLTAALTGALAAILVSLGDDEMLELVVKDLREMVISIKGGRKDGKAC